VSAAAGTGGKDGRALVVGPLAMPGFLLVLIGVRRRRRVFVLAGAVLVGLAVKLVDRSRETAGEWEGAAETLPSEPPAQPTTPPEPETEPQVPAPPKAPEPPKPRASASPPTPLPGEPETHRPDPDQPETA
jgi:hypothetical protein